MAPDDTAADNPATGYPASDYLDYLPAIFRSDEFVGRFLLAFEAVLNGDADVGEPGLERLIGRLADHFDPDKTPEEFLPWLASWVALSLRADWDVLHKRAFIAEVVSLYRWRGTLEGLKRMLEIYIDPVDSTRDNVVVFDDFAQPAHFFQVQVKIADQDPERLRRSQEIARAIIDQEKPAHTFYALKVVIPTMRLVSEDRRRQEDNKPALLMLGRNTLLGTAIPEKG